MTTRRAFLTRIASAAAAIALAQGMFGVKWEKPRLLIPATFIFDSGEAATLIK